MIRSGAFLAAFAFILSAPGFASIPQHAGAVKINQIGRLHLGDSIDAIPSIAKEKSELHHQSPRARFHVYWLDPALPARCLNLQCGTFATRILSHGGFLMGGHDETYRHEAGIDGPAAVLLVTDRADRVRAIYRGVAAADLETILRDAENF